MPQSGFLCDYWAAFCASASLWEAIVWAEDPKSLQRCTDDRCTTTETQRMISGGEIALCCWFWCWWDKQAAAKPDERHPDFEVTSVSRCFLCSQKRNFAGKYEKIS